MTSSLNNIGGKSRITVQALKWRLISFKRALIAREAIHSDEFSTDLSHGSTKNLELPIRAGTIARAKIDFPSSTLIKP